jgi:hypothetical protein
MDMPLPVGTYILNANGVQYNLVISSSATGFTGTVSNTGNNFTIVGNFDETSQVFRFLLTNSSTSPPSLESYTGTLFTSVTTAQDIDHNTIQTTVNTLAGLFEAFPNSVSGPASPSGVFTWLATASHSVKIKEAKEKEASKDTKDVKDHKDAHLEKPFDTPGDGGAGKGGRVEMMSVEAGAMPKGDLNATVNQLMQRLSAVEQQLAVGQSFIAQEERPSVGLHAIEEPRPGFPQ